MVQNSSIVETILKSKALGAFLIFWGVTFLLRAIADFEYYILHWGEETLVESATWITYEVFAIGAAVALFAIAIKVLKR